MIMIESKLKAADNAGGILFTVIRIPGGFKRRYAGLGETVGAVSHSRKAYKRTFDKKKLKKLSLKVKKKRKINNKTKKQPNLRPYLALLVALKKTTRRKDGSYIKFDENRMMTFTEPTKFGPAGKTENIPNFIGTKAFGPVSLELVKNKTIRTRFKSVISKSGGIVQMLHRYSYLQENIASYFSSKFTLFSQTTNISLYSVNAQAGLYKPANLLQQHLLIFASLIAGPATLFKQAHGKRQKKTVFLGATLYASNK